MKNEAAAQFIRNYEPQVIPGLLQTAELLGIVPLTAETVVSVENFMMFDNRTVKIEGHTAELTVTQPREVALYGRAFDVLAGQSVTGDKARALIRTALEIRRSPDDQG
ncbi:Scr1 family TA system antitoxin-like transcriptional regulator [Nocardia sp. N2S4-5]|uniref:Scr1 family TA system antitoxin-like transcriptional regulator n=1 Tax=Nocardia sp. N2S4-5 TaxID=3351565 RepID=UPI0037CE938A